MTKKSVAMATSVTLNIVYADEWKMESVTMKFSANETLAGLRDAIGKTIVSIKKSSWKSLVLTLDNGGSCKVLTNESGRKGFSKIGIADKATIHVTFSDEKEAERVAKAKTQVAKAKSKAVIAKATSSSK